MQIDISGAAGGKGLLDCVLPLHTKQTDVYVQLPHVLLGVGLNPGRGARFDCHNTLITFFPWNGNAPRAGW